jgi:apolipoprotein N-acyltransferase
VLLALLGVVLLLISFAPFGVDWVAWFALVPWALAMAGGRRPRLTLLVGYLCGLVFWLLAVYWLIFPTGVGYLAACAYLALYWLIAAWLLRASVRRNWPCWVVLPIVWVALEFARAYVISGFGWFFLAQSQYGRVHLIQIADVTGQYGLSFIVAMVNGLIVDMLAGPLFSLGRRRVRLARRMLAGVLTAAVCLGVILGYGAWRLSQRTTSPGPRIGLVQEAEPIAVGRAGRSERELLELHIHHSLRFIGQGCDLVIWPETMLPNGLNREVLDADFETMPPGRIRGLAKRFFGPQQVEQADIDNLVRNLRSRIGTLPGSAYRAAAARRLLDSALQPAHLSRLDDEQVRRLASRLLGEEAVADRRMEVLRAAIRLYLPGDDPSDVPAEVLSEAMSLVAGSETALPEDPAAALAAIRAGIRKTLARDERLLRTRRGTEALAATTSLLVGCPILSGSATVVPSPTAGEATWLLHNSVLVVRPDGVQPGHYAKMHLVPFGEYVPFRETFPALHRWLRSFVPAAMWQLDPGRGFRRFEFDTPSPTWEVATPICYEGTFARVVRRMVNADGKDRLVVANLSNDGWFVYRWGDRSYQGSTEHHQHLVHYVFRAVENRVPVVRAVNTGISGYIDSNGRIQSLLELRVGEYRKTTMVAKSQAVDVSLDSRRTFYTRWGDVFASATCLAGGVLLWRLWRTRSRKST